MNELRPRGVSWPAAPIRSGLRSLTPLLLAGLIGCSLLPAAQAADRVYQARVTRVFDGDTLWVQPLPDGRYRKLRLDGLKVVLDCANGAAYRAAPDVLWELGADVIPLGVKPDGFNINDGVGSTHSVSGPLVQEALDFCESRCRSRMERY